jgi:hypothetical protein
MKSRPLAGLTALTWAIHELVLDNGRVPVTEFLDGLEEDDQDGFVARFEQMLSAPAFTPTNTFKTYEGIWQVFTYDYRILGFRDGDVLVLTNGFKKTGRKTPPEEVTRCQELKNQYTEQQKIAQKSTKKSQGKKR